MLYCKTHPLGRRVHTGCKYCGIRFCGAVYLNVLVARQGYWSHFRNRMFKNVQNESERTEYEVKVRLGSKVVESEKCLLRWKWRNGTDEDECLHSERDDQFWLSIRQEYIYFWWGYKRNQHISCTVKLSIFLIHTFYFCKRVWESEGDLFTLWIYLSLVFSPTQALVFIVLVELWNQT